MKSLIYIKKTTKKHHKNFDENQNDKTDFFYKDSFTLPKKQFFYRINHNFDIVRHQQKRPLRIKKNNINDNLLLAKSLNIGYYLITPLLLGVFFGYWLDKFFGTRPVFLLIMIIFGGIASFYNLLKITQENGNQY